jgi:hypothetical protein
VAGGDAIGSYCEIGLISPRMHRLRALEVPDKRSTC